MSSSVVASLMFPSRLPPLIAISEELSLNSPGAAFHVCSRLSFPTRDNKNFSPPYLSRHGAALGGVIKQ